MSGKYVERMSPVSSVEGKSWPPKIKKKNVASVLQGCDAASQI